jgi:hypothetical protein
LDPPETSTSSKILDLPEPSRIFHNFTDILNPETSGKFHKLLEPSKIQNFPEFSITLQTY